MTLAVVTRRLTARTQQDVQAAIRAADAAEAALATSTRPFLVEVPLGRFFKRIPMTTFLSTTGEGTAVRYVEQDEADIDIDVYNETDFRLELPLRNAGQGIALLGQPHLEIDAGSLSWRGVTLSAARLGESGAIVTVSIPYTDASGGQATTTRAVLRRRVTDETDQWQVERLELFHTGDDQPFAVLSGRSSNSTL